MGNQQVHCNASIGIASFPEDGEDADSLVKSADIAMYYAKEKGKGHFRVFSSELNARVMHRVAIESCLRHALKKHEFLLYYQPKWDLRKSCITGVEVLLRWQSAEFGFVLPSEFIPLTENTGLIVSIGEWVLRTACLQSKKWSLAGHANLQVAVNVSGHNLNLNVLAEGVETDDQWDFLASRGCGEIQGYYLAKPMSTEDFATTLALKQGMFTTVQDDVRFCARSG